MSQFDLSVISSAIVEQKVREILTQMLATTNFKVTVESGSKHGDNFIGIIYRVTAEDIGSDDKHDGKSKKMRIILKVAPKLAILNCFRELQERNGIVPEENGFHEYAECYGVVDREPDESLLLEDLKEAGFVMIDHRKDRVTIDHARLVFDALGKFHALSFALRDQQPDKFRDLAERIPEILLRLNNSDALRGYFDWLKGLVYSAIDESESSTLVKIKEKIDDSLFEVGAAMVDGAAAEPYAVICHGDCWINNILFHFDEDHKPIQIRLLDLQHSRYASPVTDLIYFLFCCTTKEFRDEHYVYLLELYHSSLSNMLRRLGCEPETLFPYDALQQQMKKFGAFALPMAAMLLPTLTSNADECPDLDEISTETRPRLNPADNPKFVRRMRGVIEDVVRLDFF